MKSVSSPGQSFRFADSGARAGSANHDFSNPSHRTESFAVAGSPDAESDVPGRWPPSEPRSPSASPLIKAMKTTAFRGRPLTAAAGGRNR